jgi:type II secretory ATPase GspE/PulE/Tfp pilus assembly ATPase PilB-like protein
VRVVCPECKEQVPANEMKSLRQRFGDQLPGTLYRGRGCRRCLGTGYRGRVGIFEMMVVTDEVRSLILKNASAPDLRRVAAGQGMRSLRDDGFRHLRDGRTSIEEVLRVTKDDAFDLTRVRDWAQGL